jgi:hypothetical protein
VPRFFRVAPRVDPVFNPEQLWHLAVAQQHDAQACPRFRDFARGHRSPFQACPVRTRRFGRPKRDSQIRIAQAFLNFRNEIVAQFDIDLTEPRLDLLSFELLGECLDELLVFRAVGKKDFHAVADTLGHIIAIDHLEGKTSSS